ncbi:MAG: transporter [Ignavibacteria bacterium]|nr:transporter [Ignavibacteria bacterium]
MKYIILIITVNLIIAACSNNNGKSDAYGNFESTEILVSAESSGKLLYFNIEEGATPDSGKVVGLIDTVQLHLKSEQLEIQKATVASKKQSIDAQIEVLRQQKKNLLVDKERLERLLKDKAATQKQMDDILGGVEVIDKQISSVETQNITLSSELKAISVQREQVEDLIKKSKIVNPANGTVLSKFCEATEIVPAGRPLYKIADLRNMYLKAYISGVQLPSVKIGQQVKVMVDKDKTSNKELQGIVSWISQKAEFTPKIIQTKEERVNMVYAIKVLVRNDGSLKIGMPGEVRF